MDRQRLRHGLGIAAIALSVAVALAAVLYGVSFVVMSLIWDDWTF